MKQVRLFVIGLFIAQAVDAQNLEFNFGGGYHFSSASQFFIDNISSSGSTTSYKRIASSFGRGISAIAGLRYSLSHWLDLWIDVRYAFSVPAVKGSTVFSGIDYYYNESNKWKSRVLQASPSIGLKIASQKLQPYARLGITVPVYSRINVSASYTSSGFGGPIATGSNRKIYRLKHTAGYTAAAGIAPALSKKLSVFVEVDIISQAIQVRRSSLVSDIVNGVEKIDTYPTATRETIYVRKLDSQTYDPNEPSRQLGFSLPYSSIGLNAGLRVKL
jgi:hypothetical protein